MQCRKSLLAVPIIVIALLSAYSLSVKGEKTSSHLEKTREDDIFADKTLVVDVAHLNKDDGLATLMLTNASVVKIGEQNFIMGKNWAAEDDNGWYADVVNLVPCDNVLRIQAMTSKQFGEYSKTFVDMPKERR